MLDYIQETKCPLNNHLKSELSHSNPIKESIYYEQNILCSFAMSTFHMNLENMQTLFGLNCSGCMEGQFLLLVMLRIFMTVRAIDTQYKKLPINR